MRTIHTIGLLLMTILAHTQDKFPKSSGLFVHTDKVIYQNNERIWFTAYILNLPSPDSAILYNTLYITLINGKTHAPVLSARYVMDAAISQGSLLLPDTLSPGDYSLVAYTNNYPRNPYDKEFQQWISVRSLNKAPFRVPAASRKQPVANGRTMPPTKVWVSLVPDSMDYHRRSKSTWKVRFIDENGRPVKGIFSVSCVYAKRLPDERKQDIQHFYYVGQYGPEKKVTLTNNLDITKPVNGYVTLGEKKPRKPVRMVLMKGKSMLSFKTREDGTFTLPDSTLYAPANSTAVVSAAGGWNQSISRVHVVETMDSINRQLARQDYPYTIPMNPRDPLDTSVFSGQELMGRYRQLREVVIKANNEPGFINGMPVKEDSTCGSWVCSAGHWRCTKTFPSIPAIAGQRYFDPVREMYIVFKGCPQDFSQQEFIKKVNPTYYAEEFPVEDYSNSESADELHLNTTLYWEYMLATNTKGEATFSFYTNDLTGIFTCGIQAITETDPVSLYCNINVVE
ncbi:MAG TPA: hypothetical protein VM802_08000 [Chitinophaga sp.]|uniref:hypothetical protein n=1 Tax=Chitinophaga sp. TaxID=1869181 RepID=UPI002BFEC94C|nr:hypothetical protein [Chitinophaga sp.]HVI44797.1 hypothetical protein [Chitinophaga sp.]